MPPSHGSIKPDATPVQHLFDTERYKEREHGTPYNSAGGGEVYSDGSFSSYFNEVRNYFADERQRPDLQSTMVIGPDLHNRTPQWLEDKMVAIDGTPLTDLARKDANHWSNRYRKELDVAEAVQEVKRQRRYEADNDVLGYVARARRFFGLSMPLDEGYAVQHVEARHKLEEEARWLQEHTDDVDAMPQLRSKGESNTATAPASSSSSSTTGAAAAAYSASSAPPSSKKVVDDHPIGVLPRQQSPLLSEVERRQRAKAESKDGGVNNDDDDAAARERKRNLGFFSAPWHALVESIETGRPLTKVANEYRPRVDFYGLDPFLDSAPSFIWFSTKCGIAIGLFQGTVKAVQAVNVDVQFLKASGVGVLSILNMSVFASVVKWGGNTTIFAMAFCVGDRLMRRIKRYTLPPHDAECRSTSNYVMGLSFSGATVGVLPWWVLNDVGLAVRMAASGLVVGGALGLMVGLSLNQLIALNTSRLDATNRQLRRYEALMRREREWAEQERNKYTSSSYVWW